MLYSIGTIYKIICIYDTKFSYIGSTFNNLTNRFIGHKAQYKNWLQNKKKGCCLFPYFKKYGVEAFKIIKIKDYNVCRTSQRDCKHLHAYEQLWINRSYGCINIAKPFNPLVKVDNKICRKKYQQSEKGKISNKKYNQSEKGQTKSKLWREENKEKIKINKKIKIECKYCKSQLNKCSLSRHQNTKKCLRAQSKQNKSNQLIIF